MLLLIFDKFSFWSFLREVAKLVFLVCFLDLRSKRKSLQPFILLILVKAGISPTWGGRFFYFCLFFTKVRRNREFFLSKVWGSLDLIILWFASSDLSWIYHFFSLSKELCFGVFFFIWFFLCQLFWVGWKYCEDWIWEEGTFLLGKLFYFGLENIRETRCRTSGLICCDSVKLFSLWTVLNLSS